MKYTAKVRKFIAIAKKVGLFKDGKLVDGIPKGNKEDVDLYYKLEDSVGYSPAGSTERSMLIDFIWDTSHDEFESAGDMLEIAKESVKELRNRVNILEDY